MDKLSFPYMRDFEKLEEELENDSVEVLIDTGSILPKELCKKYGLKFMEIINKHGIGKFKSGGFVGENSSGFMFPRNNQQFEMGSNLSMNEYLPIDYTLNLLEKSNKELSKTFISYLERKKLEMQESIRINSGILERINSLLKIHSGNNQ